jgi:hypothetical protein
MNVENIPARDKYEQECFEAAKEYLRDPDVQEAITMLLVEKGMNYDEIRAAAEIMDMIESGDFD